MTEMLRLTAYISGKAQESGYRDRAVGIARIFGLTGYAKNQEDVRVKVVAEGEAADLQHLFLALDSTKERDAVDIQNEYSPSTGDFELFLDTDTPDRYFELMIEASRGIKELQSILKEMKAERLGSHE
jgi:acylphosphatase